MGIFSDLAKHISLRNAAETYARLGFSVIPIWGDLSLDRPKAAAVPWRQFQAQHPTSADFDTWFQPHKAGGLAVLTGRISRLIVLDFDDENRAEAFAQAFPHLIQTRIVRSAGRGLPHYYYRLPDENPVSSISGDGVDLQAEGRYVVAPPTRIEGRAYRLDNHQPILRLTMTDIDAISAFVRTSSRNKLSTPQKTQTQPILADSGPSVPVPSPNWVTEDDLLAYYATHAPTDGRNNTLFAAAIRARDAGWSQSDVVASLAQRHAVEPPHHEHPPETTAQRLVEAAATIASAFSRSARPPAFRQHQQPRQGLPNSLREALMQQGLMPVVRVLDGLYMAGYDAGQRLTEKTICDILKGVVGRHSIRAALVAVTPDNAPIFADDTLPPPTPPSRTDVAPAIARRSDTPCGVSGVTEPDKNRRGRPARVFRLPDLTRLCAAFGVHWTESDPLKAVDLSSVRRYREALHRELIKRRPGVYTVEWLSERFGVSRRSVQRYSRQFGLLVDPHYIETPITWETLSNVPEDEDDTPEWVFLCDEDGHYYPAVRPIARRLLNQEKRVSLMRQTGNVYRHISHYAPQRVDHASKNAPKSPEKGVNSYGEMWLRLYGHEARKNPQNVPSWVFALLPRDPDTITPLDPPVPLPDMPPNTPPPVPRRPPPEMPPAYEPQSRRYYRQPLPDAEREQTAQWLYDQLRIGSTDNEKKSTQCLSMVSARRLADEFAAADIRKAVTIVRARRNVRNPAGFVTAYVRQQHRARVRRIAAERQRYFERYPDAVADAPSQIDLL